MEPNPQEAYPMQTDHREILHLLKYGRSEEVRALAEQQKKQNYPNEFCPFMEQMIREYGISRKNVAVRSGLSQDYVYKLLRGDKHTDERDYILAMCFAIGMSLAQTQHALSSYGMPILSEGDLRSHIILTALHNRDGIDTLDEMLEKAGFPLLKTSPDMPSARIMSTLPSGAEAAPPVRRRRTLTELESFTDGHPNGGNAPFDYDYQGWIRVRDEAGQVYQAEAVFASAYTSFIVFTDEQRRKAEALMAERDRRRTAFVEKHREVLAASGGQLSYGEHPDLYMEYLALDEDLPEAEMLESYDRIEDAAGSDFFPFFLEIDKNTDKKVLEVLRKLDDTREYGHRVGSAWHGGGQPMIYIEMFNDRQPENREYFQLVEYRDGTCRYTASHESCFMQLEMGRDLYRAYFGTAKRDPEFYIDTDSDRFTGAQVRYRFIFHLLRMLLHEEVLKTGGFVEMDPAKVREEKIEFLIEQGVQAHLGGDERQSVSLMKEALALMAPSGAPEERRLTVYACTCLKIALSLQGLKDPEEEEWWQRLWALKDAVTAACEKDPDGRAGALSSLVDAGLHFFRAALAGKSPEARGYLEQVLDLMDTHHASADDWPAQFEVRASHAFMMEERDLQKAAEEYRAALNIARDRHLDQDPFCARGVAVHNFNFGWVLWNRLNSEEAVLYYGRAIDLLESYLSTGVVDRDTVLRDLAHTGEALDRVYIDTSRPQESLRLKARLKESGVTLE